MDLDSTILLMSSPDSSSLAIRLVFLGDTACFHLCPHQQRGLDIVVYAAAYRHGLISVKCLRLTIGQDKLMRKWLSNTWNLINSFIEIEILSKRLSLRDSITPVIFWQLHIRYIMYWRQLHTTYMNKASNSYLTQQTWLLHCLLHLPGPSSPSAESTKTPTTDGHNVTLSRVPTHAILTVVSHCMQAKHSS